MQGAGDGEAARGRPGNGRGGEGAACRAAAVPDPCSFGPLQFGPLRSPPCSGRKPHHLGSSSSSSVLWNLGIRAVAAGQPRMRVWRSSGCGCGSRRASVGSHSQSTPTSHLGSVLSTSAGCFSVRSGLLSTVIHRVWGQRCGAGSGGRSGHAAYPKSVENLGKGGERWGQPGGNLARGMVPRWIRGPSWRVSGSCGCARSAR